MDLSKLSAANDRNFDDVADHFVNKIYGGLKGRLRQSVILRDLTSLGLFKDVLDKQHEDLVNGEIWRVIDLGAGAGQFVIQLAELGHRVVYNDISEKMATFARNEAIKKGLAEEIEWRSEAWQTTLKNIEGNFDIIFCHALLEWLAEPESLFSAIKSKIKPGGYVSLCFYNPHGLIYHNLIRGNFDWINRAKYDKGIQFAADPGGLTPSNPCSYDQVSEWLREIGFKEVSVSGIRVFSDYANKGRGGNSIENEVVSQELRFSLMNPYKWMGRYLHIVAKAIN